MIEKLKRKYMQTSSATAEKSADKDFAVKLPADWEHRIIKQVPNYCENCIKLDY